jgi:uncharacterized protein (TIGR02145 family)
MRGLAPHLSMKPKASSKKDLKDFKIFLGAGVKKSVTMCDLGRYIIYIVLIDLITINIRFMEIFMGVFNRLGLALSVLTAGVAVGLSGCEDNGAGSSGGGSVVYGDPLVYGGQTYKTVKIGGQTWMAENLNIKTEDSRCYGEGGRVNYQYYVTDSGTIYVPEYLTSAQVQANCAKYGRLYSWEAAMTACPAGWKLPDSADWDRLETAVGDWSGYKLKAKSGWSRWEYRYGDLRDGNGTDEYGFSALPGGGWRDVDPIDGVENDFSGVGRIGCWWTASDATERFAARFGFFRDVVYIREIWNYIYMNQSVTEGFSEKSGVNISVRCVKDD